MMAVVFCPSFVILELMSPAVLGGLLLLPLPLPLLSLLLPEGEGGGLLGLLVGGGGSEVLPVVVDPLLPLLLEPPALAESGAGDALSRRRARNMLG